MTPGDPRSPVELLLDELANAENAGLRVRHAVEKGRTLSYRSTRTRPVVDTPAPYDGPTGRALADLRRLTQGYQPAGVLQARIDAALEVIGRELPADVAFRLEAILTGLEDERGRPE